MLLGAFAASFPLEFLQGAELVLVRLGWCDLHLNRLCVVLFLFGFASSQSDHVVVVLSRLRQFPVIAAHFVQLQTNPRLIIHVVLLFE